MEEFMILEFSICVGFLPSVVPDYFTFQGQWKGSVSWWYIRHFSQLWFQMLETPSLLRRVGLKFITTFLCCRCLGFPAWFNFSESWQVSSAGLWGRCKESMRHVLPFSTPVFILVFFHHAKNILVSFFTWFRKTIKPVWGLSMKWCQ